MIGKDITTKDVFTYNIGIPKFRFTHITNTVLAQNRFEHTKQVDKVLPSLSRSTALIYKDGLIIWVELITIKYRTAYTVFA